MEDILFCIIIVITPFGDVVPLIRDVIDVIVHVKYWGKTFIVIRVNNTTKLLLKYIFESPKASRPWLGSEVSRVGLLGFSTN